MSQRRCQWITKSLRIKKKPKEKKIKKQTFSFFLYEACPIISCSIAEAVSS